MLSQAVAIAAGAVCVGAWCLWGAVAQVRSGETWGGTGKGRVYRTREPGYFWYMFGMRVVWGCAALIPGLLALKQLGP